MLNAAEVRNLGLQWKTIRGVSTKRMNMKGVSQMNARILVIPLAAALVGGCASYNERHHYVSDGPYAQRIVVPRGGYVEGGRRYYYDGGRRYYIDGGRRYYFDGNRRYYEERGRRHYIDELRREARKEQEFVRNVGKTKMKMQQQAAQAQMKAKVAQSQMRAQQQAAQAQMKAAQAQAQMKAAQAQAQMKAQQQAAKAKQQAAKAKMQAAAKMKKR